MPLCPFDVYAAQDDNYTELDFAYSITLNSNVIFKDGSYYPYKIYTVPNSSENYLPTNSHPMTFAVPVNEPATETPSILLKIDPQEEGYSLINPKWKISFNNHLTDEVSDSEVLISSSVLESSLIGAAKAIAVADGIQLLTYKITYLPNGGAGAPQYGTKTYGQSYIISSYVPTYPGNVFLGWSTDPNATTPQYVAGNVYTTNADLTLYAVWKNTFTITFDSNGGSSQTVYYTKNYGQPFIIPNYTPVYTGRAFLGWSTNRNATAPQYVAGSTYTTEADLYLYAVWQLNTYTITYNANGGTDAPSAQSKAYGSSIQLSTQTPTRKGYTFLYWSTSSDGNGTNYAPGGIYSANANATLYAQWGAGFKSNVYVWVRGVWVS